MEQKELISFLIRAKQNTYAGGKSPEFSSRTASHDLQYSEGDLSYYDSYLGGYHFIGEEAVWENGIPLWGMNYYGKMLCKEIPGGFSDFLKQALMRVPDNEPYRGPREYIAGDYLYSCRVNGEFTCYKGVEEILKDGDIIYRLIFHGGEIRD